MQCNWSKVLERSFLSYPGITSSTSPVRACYVILPLASDQLVQPGNLERGLCTHIILEHGDLNNQHPLVLDQYQSKWNQKLLKEIVDPFFHVKPLLEHAKKVTPIVVAGDSCSFHRQSWIRDKKNPSKLKEIVVPFKTNSIRTNKNPRNWGR